FLGAVEQFGAVDDLQDAALVGAVTEIDAVAFGARRDRAVQLGRHRAGRARLLAGQAEIPDLYRMGRVGEIVDLRHAPRAPARRPGYEICDSRVALPPALMGVLQAVETRDELGARRIDDVPDLVRLPTERAQQIDGVAIALGQRLAVAHAHHLRAAL